MDKAELFVDSRCELGEGAFWHPELQRLFWFDIFRSTLFSAGPDGQVVDRITFDTMPSAAGVIDGDHLAVATIDGIDRLQLSTGRRERVAPLEPNRAGRRSNDGRIDRSGGFWIGTMSLAEEEKPSGVLYQLRRGVLTAILGGIRVPNGTCFSPDGTVAYFADSPTRTIRRIATDPLTGVPRGEWRDFARSDPPNQPDGAVVDSAGFVWSAQWDGGSVVRYAPDGTVDRVVAVPASRPTCTAFGGADLKTLYITSARDGLSPGQLSAEPHAGGVFAIRVDVPGLAEVPAQI